MLLSLLFAYGVQCMVNSSWQPVAWQTLAGKLAVALIVLLPVCYLLEVRLQRQINRWTDKLLIRADLTGRVSALRASKKSYGDLALTADSAATAGTRAGRT